MNTNSPMYLLAKIGYELYKKQGDSVAKDFMLHEMTKNGYKFWEAICVKNTYNSLKAQEE